MVPHNIELEKNIISILVSCSEIDELLEFLGELKRDYFFMPSHRDLFDEILEMSKKRLIPDLISLESKMVLLQLDMCDYISRAMPFQMPTMTSELKNVYIKRCIFEECSRLLGLTQDAMQSGSDIINETNTAINEIVQNWRDKKTFTTPETIEEATRRVIEASKSETNRGRIPYSTFFVDNAVTIYRKQIHTMGGMQGTGKTAFALNCFRNQILEGQNVIYFCTESDRQEIMQRIFASDMRCSIQNLLEGFNGNAGDLNRLSHSVKKFIPKSGNFWIYGLGDFELSIDDVGIISKKILRDAGRLDMIYLDFLQDLKGNNKSIDERELIGQNIKGFKDICVDCDCAGTVLSQFNRETHNQGKPTKKSFRGSGVIDDVSHIMSVLYRENYDESQEQPEDEPIKVWWYSVKTRLIKPWSRCLGFIGKTCNYAPFEEHRYSKEYCSTD